MLAYLAGNVGPSCGYVGLCWPPVDPCWAKRSEKWEQPEKHCKMQDILMVGGLSWGYVGLRLIHVEPKDPKNGNRKKNTVKRRRFWWSAAYLGAMLAHLGAMLAYLEGNVGPSWGYVGPSWGDVGPSWSYVGPSWGDVGPSWGLCWPILGLCSPFLTPMLAHVDPSWATSSEKGDKMRRAQNTVKRDSFWRGGEVGGRGRGPSLLRRGENRLRQCHGQGAPGRI